MAHFSKHSRTDESHEINLDHKVVPHAANDAVKGKQAEAKKPAAPPATSKTPAAPTGATTKEADGDDDKG